MGSDAEKEADGFARLTESDQVVVGSVVAHPPLTRRQAERIAAIGLLADDPAALLLVWARLAEMWGATVAKARALTPVILDRRVNGEWSFLETLRHLVFVTDAWIGEVVEAAPSPYDPLGLPPNFVTNGRELGLDLEATPAPEEVFEARLRATTHVHDLISRSTPAGLARKCAPREGRFRVVGALQVVIFEEWAHNMFAERDLALLTADP